MRRMSQRGVTLLELLIAMMLLAVALVGLAASFPLAVFGVTAGGFQTTATLLAQQSIEVAKHTPYALLPSTDSGGFQLVPGYSGGFTRNIQVQQGFPTVTTTTVTVVVRFRGGTGLNDSTVATIFSQ